MTYWGAFNARMRLGLDVWTDPYDTWTPGINVYVQVHAQSDGWKFDDNQHTSLDITTGQSWAWDWRNTLSGSTIYSFPVVKIPNQGQSYGGGPTYGISATLSGNYVGGNSSVNMSFTLPARPIRPTSQPSQVTFRNLTAESFTAALGNASDHGGSTPDQNEFMLFLAGGNAVHHSIFNTSVYPQGWHRYPSGLAPDTLYTGISRLHNAAGASAWSAWSDIRTLPFQVKDVTVSNVRPDSASVTWQQPEGGNPVKYEFEYATNSGFTQNLQTIPTTSRSITISGLQPNTTYFTRARGFVSGGPGVWSATGSFKTLSGTKVFLGSQWKDSIPQVRVGNTWRQANVKKYTNGEWR